MKHLLLFSTLLLFSSTLFADEQLDNYIAYEAAPIVDTQANPKIEVTLNEIDQPISCHLDTISKFYICPGDKSSFIVRYSPGLGFSAIGKNAESKNPKMFSVKSVTAGEKILQEAFPLFAFAGMDTRYKKPAEDLNHLSINTVSHVESFLGISQDLKGKITPRIQGSEEYEKMVNTYLDDVNRLKKIVNSASNDSHYKIELTNGQSINCQRGTTTPLNNYNQKKYGKDYKCGSFKCDPVTINNVEYNASMIFDSSPGSFVGSSIHLTNKNKVATPVFVTKVISNQSVIPLIDNTSYFENEKISKETQVVIPNFPGYKEPLPQAFPEKLEKVKDYVSLYQNPNFEMALQYYKNICGDDQGAMKNTLESKDKVRTIASEAKLVQFIALLNDGSLAGQLIDPNQAGKYGCYYKGVYLNEAAAKNLDLIEKNLNPDLNVEQTIGYDRADELFNKAKAMNDIAWNYKQDGCYARAHLMARRFEAEGVRVDKVWIKGNLYVPGTKNQPEISWNFHVAPIVYVKDSKGKINKMVIDPSLFDHPVTVEEWDKKMSKKTKLGSEVALFPYPENAAFMERSVLAFSSSDPYLPTEIVNTPEDDKLRRAQKTMAEYKKYIPEPNSNYGR